ncbi:LysR family transcriptional regulator [Vibrio ishigakensis]|uniref:LysR family transcriptional regulator n=1 Tax=Vibrio ishigakensis TaxID=1481914 RepID=UPI0021C4B2C5|nr:LysR family transcriptional regulator [Vibrio ishigakensis]
MNWTLDQLQAFVMAAELGSFSAAARKLDKAQSRVSTAVANLETDLGFELFDRSRRLPELTALGHEMLLEAKAVLEQAERLQSRALTASREEEIELVLAFDEAVQVLAFQPVIIALAKKFPHLKLTIINGSRDDISQYVLQKKAAMGILFRTKEIDAQLEFTALGQYQMRLVVSNDHPLTHIKSPSLSDLQKYRQFVICDKTGRGRDKPLVADHWYIDSYYVIGDLVGNGLGWALIPEHIVNSEFYVKALKALSLKSLPLSETTEVGLIRRRDTGFGVVGEWLHTELPKMFLVEE